MLTVKSEQFATATNSVSVPLSRGPCAVGVVSAPVISSGCAMKLNGLVVSGIHPDAAAIKVNGSKALDGSVPAAKLAFLAAC